MTRARLPLAALLALAAVPAAALADAPAPVLLEGFAAVQGLRIADADGDGIPDVMLVSGRDVRIFRGKKGGPVAASPSWSYRVPDAATFAWPGRVFGEPGARVPSLLALAGATALRLLPGKPPIAEEGLPAVPAWSDPAHAVLTDFVRGAHAFFPTETGYRWIPDWAGARDVGYDLLVEPRRKVVPAGPFLEEGATATAEWPTVTLVPSWPGAAGKPAAFVLTDDAVHAFVPTPSCVAEVRWGTSFLPSVGDGRMVLADLDGDGTPDLCHEATTNETGAYTFFRIPLPPAPVAAPAARGKAIEGGEIRPPSSAIRLTGYQFPPDYVDLDGDGRLDMAVTTIEIDANNVVSAVFKGRVTAKTRAFLNRSKGGGSDLFPGTPDAEVDSPIGVRLRFTFAGAIEVKRSFTIIATADLDGDGKKDLVIRTASDTLSVHKGTASGVWEKEPAVVKIPAMGTSPDIEGYAADLTGDGKDDLVLLYKAAPGGEDRVYVIVSP